ncbi:MAG: PepSY domain-containing protein [Verrucomicrobia bacterium]|nr:PepSY domain-containing protein [Verrucomicrobiota bacterium]
MKSKLLLASLLAFGLVVAGCQSLESQAKISRADAEKAALAKVPGGTIKEGELEKEHGKLIWSFDIATPGTKDVTEVQVDAVTGAVVSVEKETPEQQEKEKKDKK